MNARTEPVGAAEGQVQSLDVEAVFRANYSRIAGIIGRIVRDPARAEELAVEVFCKLWKHRGIAPGAVNAWLYTTGVRLGLDELRRRSRRQKYERLFSRDRSNPTPEQAHSIIERQEQVRTVLAALRKRDAELLILRGEGLSYREIADLAGVKPTSIGTLLRRAHEAFQKEYRRRYE